MAVVRVLHMECCVKPFDESMIYGLWSMVVSFEFIKLNLTASLCKYVTIINMYLNYF